MTFISSRPCSRRRLGLRTGLVAATAAVFSPFDLHADPLPARAAIQIERALAEKHNRTWYKRKISSALLKAIKPRVRGPRRPLARDRDGRIEVEITGTMDGPLPTVITAMGGNVANWSARHRRLRGWMPMARLTDLAQHPDVDFIRESLPAEVRRLDVSEGDVSHFADQARAVFGVDGAGNKICVISDGVDSLSERQATGDVPPAVDILPGAAGSGDEGTAMLEIVSDLAPGADLGFATGIGGEAVFAVNIERLRFEAGCDVIVDDLGYFTEGVFQDDIVALAVDAVAADGALYFSAAGNSGNLNDGQSGVWQGDFASAALTTGGAVHGFAADEIFNLISVDSPFFFTLHWSDPLGASANDYDLFLVNSAGLVLAASTDFQDGSQDPFEIIDSRAFNDAGLSLVVVQARGAEPRVLHLNANRGRLAIGTAGQISGHAAADGALAVAAVDWRQAPPGDGFDGTAEVETFSSDGPRVIFYDPDGAPLTPGNVLSGGGVERAKPDLAAADGVSTSTPGFESFFGTSAAAPHAAAIAGLVWSANPDLDAAGVRAILTTTAIDVEAPGPDRDSGAGIVDAFAAVEAAASFGDTANPVVFVTDMRARTRTTSGRTRGGVDVSIADPDGNAVAGASVTGTYGGDFTGSSSGVTNADGVVTVLTTVRVSGEPAFTFCVDDIVADGLTYSPDRNAVTCVLNEPQP